jgi:hypothetical protein
MNASSELPGMAGHRQTGSQDKNLLPMQYQHPELEIVRAALDNDTAVENRA